MMEKRPVAGEFVNAMEKGLAHGRKMGRKGWDTHWQEGMVEDTQFGLLDKLEEEVRELIEAVENQDSSNIVLREAADVANIAMMLADIMPRYVTQKNYVAHASKHAPKVRDYEYMIDGWRCTVCGTQKG